MQVGDLVTVDRELRVFFRHASIADACTADTTKPILYYRRLLEAFDDEDDRVETLASMLHCARGCGDDDANGGRLRAAPGTALSLHRFARDGP